MADEQPRKRQKLSAVEAMKLGLKIRFAEHGIDFYAADRCSDT
jgi:hypothetical protein